MKIQIVYDVLDARLNRCVTYSCKQVKTNYENCRHGKRIYCFRMQQTLVDDPSCVTLRRKLTQQFHRPLMPSWSATGSSSTYEQNSSTVTSMHIRAKGTETKFLTGIICSGTYNLIFLNSLFTNTAKILIFLRSTN